MAAALPEATHLKGSLRDLSGWKSYWHPRPPKDGASIGHTPRPISRDAGRGHRLVPEEAWGQKPAPPCMSAALPGTSPWPVAPPVL